MSKIQRVAIRSAIEQYLNSDRVKRQAAGTTAHRKRTLRVLAEVMEGLRASDMSGRHVDQVLARLRPTRAETTLNIDRNNLRAFEKWLHENNLLTPWDRPTSGLAHVPEDPHTKTLESLILTPDQAKLALDVAEAMHPRERILVALGLYGFLRESEMLVLQWENIKPDPGNIEFRRKKQRNAYHKIPIFKPLRAELEKWRAWLEEHNGPIQGTDYVIPARGQGGQGRRLDPDYPVIPSKAPGELTRCVKPVLAAVGFRRLRQAGIHTLRRTGACHLYDECRDIGLVQRMLGHKDRATTERYLKWWEGFDELSELAENYDPYGMAPQAVAVEEQSNVIPFRRVVNG